jgi:hypothetical protein
MRLEQHLPRIGGVAVISGASVLTLLRQLDFGGERLELVLVGTDHVADDLVGALLVEAVLVVIGDFVSRFAITAVGQEPTLSRLGEHAIRKRRPHLDQPDGGKRIGGVFHLAHHRQTHLRDRCMGHFVKQHEQHIAGYEFRNSLDIFQGSILVSRSLGELPYSSVDPRLEISRFRPPRRFRRRRRLG